LLRRERRIEQLLRICDVQIVRDVEDVRDDGALDEALLNAQVDIAEGRGMCVSCGWQRQENNGRTQNSQNTQKELALRAPRVPRAIS